MKKIMHFYNNKLIKWFIIPFILLIVGVGFSLIFYPNASLATIEQNDITLHAPGGKLLQGESITGEFTATENNLGIVQIRFQNFKNKINDNNQDKVIFSIKEKGAKTWWYQNTYKEKDIILFPFYPFGFSKITDSKGKKYVFTITSLEGNKYNALEVSPTNPTVISKYVFTRRELLNHKSLFLKKTINMFTQIDFLLYSFHFFYPLIIYLTCIIIFKFYPKSPNILIFSSAILTGFSVFANIDLFLSVFIPLIILWIWIVYKYSLESNILFYIAGFFLFFSFVSIFSGAHDVAGRFSNWTYIFLIIGTVQLLGEFKKPTKMHFTDKMFLQRFLSNSFIKKFKKFNL